MYEEGWQHLGDDCYYHAAKRQVAGPIGRDQIRIPVNITMKDLRDSERIETIQDISVDWERLVNTETLPRRTSSYTDNEIAVRRQKQ